MRELYRADLERLGRDLSEIARLVHRAMMDAQAALEAADVHGAERVISEDARIDQLQESLDEQAVRILALQAPVATDLRTVVATLRMSSSLERMGDLAAHIAQLARMRYPDESGASQVREYLLEMGALDVAQSERLVRLFETEEPSLIDEIIAADDEIDAKHKQVLDTLGELEKTEDASTTKIVDATLANRYLERFSDHAVSIAKRIRYQQEGAEQDA